MILNAQKIIVKIITIFILMHCIAPFFILPIFAQDKVFAQDKDKQRTKSTSKSTSETTLGTPLGATNENISDLTFTQKYSPQKNTYKVAEPIKLELQFIHNIDIDIVPPESLPTQRWHIIDTKTESQTLDNTKKKTTIVMLVSVNRPGSTVLPPMKFTALQRSGESFEVSTRKIQAKFLSSLPDSGEIAFKEARPPITIWVEDLSLLWIGGVALLALLFFALYFFMKTRTERIIIPPTPRAAHDIAIEKLSALASHDLDKVDDENYMDYYVRLSEAVREYIGKIWNFPGTELTTTEILAYLHGKTFPLGISPDEIGSFLKEIDYVKFAGVRLDNEAGARLLRQAFSFVELTRPLSLSKHTSELSAFREKYGTEDSNDAYDNKKSADSTLETQIVDDNEEPTAMSETSEDSP